MKCKRRQLVVNPIGFRNGACYVLVVAVGFFVLLLPLVSFNGLSLALESEWQDAHTRQHVDQKNDPWASIHPRTGPELKSAVIEPPSSTARDRQTPFLFINKQDASPPMNFAGALSEMGCDPSNPLKLSQDQLNRLSQHSTQVVRLFRPKWESLERFSESARGSDLSLVESLVLQIIEERDRLQLEFTRAINDVFLQALNDRQVVLLRNRTLANALYDCGYNRYSNFADDDYLPFFPICRTHGYWGFNDEIPPDDRDILESIRDII
ncbi:MAG TPA: hypothetical protein PKD54_01875 [Pirellulaceae bacterium]|nr:hypothetical protein [Pirellulaceae bacterium]